MFKNDGDIAILESLDKKKKKIKGIEIIIRKKKKKSESFS